MKLGTFGFSALISDLLKLQFPNEIKQLKMCKMLKMLKCV